MEIYRSLQELAASNEALHVAFGVFDGVHIGHQEVIASARASAQKYGGRCGVITFDPHPIQVMAPHVAPRALLANLEQKLLLFKRCEVDFVTVLTFDSALAKLEATDFLEQLFEAPVKSIAVGQDWRFGAERRGDTYLLREQALVRNCQLNVIQPVKDSFDRISSTRIRQAIQDGNLEGAAVMLGRPFAFHGTVQHGRKLGKELGFPTANLRTEGLQVPPDGVWSVRVEWRERTFSGVANLGFRPTVDGSQHGLEVHLFDMNENLYGESLDITFVHYLRTEKKFEKLDDLKQQIARDIEQARSFQSLEALA